MGRPAVARGATPIVALLCAVAALVPAGAGAAIPASLHHPESCVKLKPAPGFSAVKCDDGYPDAGGTAANETGAKAITVPAAYRGYKGLPPKAAGAEETPGADSSGNIALDVDITLPTRKAPAGGYPMVFMMHGCCGGSRRDWEAESFDAGGEAWHYSNAWFAARGYVVVTWTSRGFVRSLSRGDVGSTGEMQLQSRSYEINDYQHLACQISGAAGRFSDVTGRRVKINPSGIVATGGSYGGGFTWLALTDPKWRCGKGTGAAGRRMSLAVVAPKYGFTNLVQELAPTGTTFQAPGKLPPFNGCGAAPVTLRGAPCPEPATPVGIPKAGIVAGLYATGKTGVPPGTATHTTFPPIMDEGIACLQSIYPPEASPLCEGTVSELFPMLMRESSAYYQNRFFRKIANHPGWRIPIFNASTFQDPLFPGPTQRAITNRLRSVVPGYPIQEYIGDTQHFVQNKAREWGDICDSKGERHVCTSADYTNGFDAPPPSRVRVGTTTLLNRFIDHYANPRPAKRPPRPRFDVTASLQVCPENAPLLGVALDEPGPTFTAPTFGALTPNVLELTLEGTQTTFSRVLINPHALAADPILNERLNGRRCPVEDDAAGAGVATYESGPLAATKTMIGGTIVTASFDPPPVTEGLELNARLYDVFPGGSAVMVDRGPRRISAEEAAAGEVTFQLHGNAWRFFGGHAIRIELAQDDFPYLKPSDIPSSLTLTGVRLRIPVR